MKTTYIHNKLGIGIFTMEGFEYKNYTSKQVLNSRTNGWHQKNITKQSLRVLQLTYKCGYHNTQHEIKRRRLDMDVSIGEYETTAGKTIQSNSEPNDNNDHSSSVGDFATVAYL
jgi:hypothetical protein